MEMAELSDKLNFAFALLFVGSLCCVAAEEKAYNLCMPTDLTVTPLMKDFGYIRVHPNRKPPDSQVQCKMNFKLCKTCRLFLHFEKSNLENNHKCYPELSSHCIHDCIYLRVVDEIYNKTNAFLFQPEEDFMSVSNSVSVTLCNNPGFDISFFVRFRVEKKRRQIDPQKTSTFKSPGFPSGYKTNGEEFLYEIRKPLGVQDMYITFTDWIMSPFSKLTVYNRERPLVFMGNSSRPVFHSSHSIRMIFSTGFELMHFSQSNVVRGFKAEIICKTPFHVSDPLPSSTCGQNMVRMDYGGRLKFSPQQDRHYDCVWVILIHPNFKLVAVHVEHYYVNTQWGKATTVQFYEGLTSEGRLVETVYPGQQFISQNPNGFYIRLRGRMEVGDLFAMTYTSLVSANSLGTCPYRFRCNNGYCIHSMLKCDGINHCLDKSDERDCGKKEAPHDQITSNWSVSIIIPVVITIFIFIILCLFFIFVRRFRKISRGAAPHRQPRVASIGGSLSQQFLQSHFSMNLTLEGELDAPPSYEEVMNTPSPRGNWNLAFNWSQQDLRDTPAPPPYSEYMRENEVNTYNGIADNDTSDLSTVPTDTSSSNNYTDPTTEDQNSTSGSDTLYSENIYETICDTPTNSLDRWMVDRSTSTTSEEGIDVDMDNNNKIVAVEPVMGTQEVNTEAPSLRKNTSDNPHHANRNNCNFALLGADSNKSSPALEYSDPLSKDDSKNNIRFRNSSADLQFLRSGRSRSMDTESNYPLDIPHNGHGNTDQNPGSKNCSSGRRNSYPSVIFLADRQLNNEVFV